VNIFTSREIMDFRQVHNIQKSVIFFIGPMECSLSDKC
jgi:hypothetical protein